MPPSIAKFYPNPFDNVLYVDDVDIAYCRDCELVIYDSNGQQIKSLYSLFSERIILEDFLIGMYFFQLKKAGKVIGSQKIAHF